MPTLTPFFSQSHFMSSNNIRLLLLPPCLSHCFYLSYHHHWTDQAKTNHLLAGECLLTDRQRTEDKAPELSIATISGAFNCGGCAFVFVCVCEWSAGDYSSNDNSTYGDWINLPEHWDHKSNLRMIILLPDEELISNVFAVVRKRRCVCGGVILRRGMFTNLR